MEAGVLGGELFGDYQRLKAWHKQWCIEKRVLAVILAPVHDTAVRLMVGFGPRREQLTPAGIDALRELFRRWSVADATEDGVGPPVVEPLTAHVLVNPDDVGLVVRQVNHLLGNPRHVLADELNDDHDVECHRCGETIRGARSLIRFEYVPSDRGCTTLVHCKKCSVATIGYLLTHTDAPGDTARDAPLETSTHEH
jgi:hypothetical protein